MREIIWPSKRRKAFEQMLRHLRRKEKTDKTGLQDLREMLGDGYITIWHYIALYPAVKDYDAPYEIVEPPKYAELIKTIYEAEERFNNHREKTLSHTKEFGVYHWDTFDDTTTLRYESDDMEDAMKWTREYYGDRLRAYGADRIDLVNKAGDIIKTSRLF